MALAARTDYLDARATTVADLGEVIRIAVALRAESVAVIDEATRLYEQAQFSGQRI